MTKNSLNEPSDWKGIWTALITPFKKDLTLDEPSLKNLIEKQIAEGIRGLVIAGSTGEGSLVNDAEYEGLLRASVKIAHARIPIVAGLGIGGTRDSVRRAQLAKNSGVAGVLASVPAYIKPPVRGLVEHFLAIARVGLGVCLYDVPGRSALGLSDDVIDALIDSKDPASENIHALKDATGKPARIKEKATWKSNLTLLSGDDESFPQFIHMGGHGIISVATHFALKDFLNTERFEKVIPFINALYLESNPIPVKSLAKKLGFIENDSFQAPLAAMQPDLLEKLYGLYKENY